MHVLQGWVRNVSASAGEWVSICFIIHSFAGEGVNADDARGVGVRGANVDWGVNTSACSGWSEG